MGKQAQKDLVKDLRILRDQAGRVEERLKKMFNDGTAQGLSVKQARAIDSVLRTLDILNEYKLGDQLRSAFGVELRTVTFHRQNGYYPAKRKHAQRRKLLSEVEG